jgi:outer membrane protein OmpA-like peptidoglycan-associated protein
LLIPLVLLGAVILGIALTRAHRAPRVGVTAPQPTMPAAPHVETPHVQTPQVQAPQVQAPTVGTPTAGAIALPGGKTLNVPSNSPQADMARTLGDNSKALPQSFAFDDLAFDPGSATPTAASTKTVDDIAAMLQAYPSARIRIKGHTDATGTPAANRALSASRASTLKDMLVARGVDPNRIETTGASEQGAQLRRAEIEVLSR